MGMTHVFVGTMSAMMLTELNSPRDCLAALIGGALGAVACDMDLGRSDLRRDATLARRTAGTVILVCLASDALLDAGLILWTRSAPADALTAGLAGSAVLCLWGRCQPHRGAAHSLMMTLLLGMCMKLICAPLSIPLMIGMGSHLALDMLNRRPMQLLYPLKGGLCLGLCRADGWVDRTLRIAGLLGTVFGVGIGIGGFL